MFLKNKYTKIYYQIVSNAKNRILDDEVYTERHHVTPKSLGGDDSDSNLVTLTAREHFICHRLLVKMTFKNNKRKMAWAVRRMLTGINKNQQRYLPNSKLYERLRKQINQDIKGWSHSEETKKHLSKVLTGRKFSEETIKKMSVSRKGKKKPDHISERLRTANLGKHMSEESKKKLSESLRGRKISDQAKKNMSLNHADVKGKNNPRAKKWKVQDPDNNVYIIEGEMTSFCTKHNLPASTMRSMGRKNYSPTTGKCAGWTVTLLNS